MKRILFVINTLGGAGAEKALLELLKRFTPDRYEVDLYVLLGQGELISQVPDYSEQGLYGRISSFSRGKERIEQKGSQTIIYT